MTDKTREELIQELKKSHKRVSQLLASMADVQDWHPDPHEWSFRIIAAHLATVERNYFMERIYRIAAGENPHFKAYTNTGWDYSEYDLHESLEEWSTARQELIKFVRDLPRDRLELTGTHEVAGTLTTLDAVEQLIKNDQQHAKHLRVLISDYEELNA